MRELLLAALVLALAGFGQVGATASHEDTEQKAVLVTGASSGIGLKITELLSAQGHYVYAGARSKDDLKMLDAMDNVEAVRLDVTKPRDIKAAVEQVEKGGRGLHGVVNNAGVAILAPLIDVAESELDFLFDVNVYGPYRITKAFAPMIIESQGRISNISSISGILSGPLYGPYSMSKHALEAYTDSLAREMARVGVKVSAVEPGNYKSKIGQNFCDRLAANREKYQSSIFQAELEAGLKRCEDDPQDTSPEPDAVAEAVMHALFSDEPKEHYMVVPTQRQASYTIDKAVEELVSYNHDHEFSYDRQSLIAKLDEQWAAKANDKNVERLAPVVRHSMLVTDLDRALTLYRDVLGLKVNRINDTSPDSYSYIFFDIPPGSMKRFAYLDTEDGRSNSLGMGEVPGLDLNIPDKPRSVAWVQTVADVEGVMKQVEELGLELIPPVEFESREAGKTGVETGVVDWDGHLVMFYGLKLSEIEE